MTAGTGAAHRVDPVVRTSGACDPAYEFRAGTAPGEWHLRGEVDSADAQRLQDDLAVACSAAPGDLHLALDSLRFIDVAGARVLVEAAQHLEPGRRLVLHRLTRNPRRVLRLTGWDRATNLVLEEEHDERAH